MSTIMQDMRARRAKSERRWLIFSVAGMVWSLGWAIWDATRIFVYPDNIMWPIFLAVQTLCFIAFFVTAMFRYNLWVYYRG